MNKHITLNIEGPLENDALRILKDIPGVKARPKKLAGQSPDFLVSTGGVTHAVELKALRATNAAAARQLVEYAKRLPKRTHLLVVTRTTTEEARRLLEEAGVGLLDTLGHMHIALPHLFLRAEGRPRPSSKEVDGGPPVKLAGKAGVVAQALLRAPERKWQVHEIAGAASVSVGLAHRVVTRLERERLLEAEGAGPKRKRWLRNPTALLDLWIEEMRDRGIKQLRAFRLARDPRTQAKTLSRLLVEAEIEHAVTGAAGAAILAPFITAIPVTDIWVPDTVALDELVGAVQAEIVQTGHNITLRQATGNGPLVFRQKVGDVWTANPFRLFFDLRQDPRRGREQADRLRREVIGF